MRLTLLLAHYDTRCRRCNRIIHRMIHQPRAAYAILAYCPVVFIFVILIIFPLSVLWKRRWQIRLRRIVVLSCFLRGIIVNVFRLRRLPHGRFPSASCRLRWWWGCCVALSLQKLKITRHEAFVHIRWNIEFLLDRLLARRCCWWRWVEVLLSWRRLMADIMLLSMTIYAVIF